MADKKPPTAAQLERREKYRQLDFEALLSLAHLKSRVASAAEIEKDDANAVVLEQMAAFGMTEGYTREDGIVFDTQTKKTVTIDRAQLIMQGVAPKVVDASTRTTYSSPFLVIRVPKALKAELTAADADTAATEEG